MAKYFQEKYANPCFAKSPIRATFPLGEKIGRA